MLKRKASSSASAARSLCMRYSSFQQPAREAVNAMLNNTVNQIEKCKASNGRKLPYRIISSIIADNKEAFPWLDANKNNYHMQKLKICQKKYKQHATSVSHTHKCTEEPRSIMGTSSLRYANT